MELCSGHTLPSSNCIVISIKILKEINVPESTSCKTRIPLGLEHIKLKSLARFKLNSNFFLMLELILFEKAMVEVYKEIAYM